MVRLYVLVAALLVLLWTHTAFPTQRVLSLSCPGYDNVDDTPCIREWIGQALPPPGEKRKERMELYVPPGTYLYNTVNQTIPLPSGVHIRCAGPGSAIFRNHGGPGALFFTDQALEDVIIENCGFDVNGGTANFLSVIAVNTSQTVQNIHIRGNRIFDSAILGQRSAQQRQYILLLPCDNCWVEGNHLSEGGRIKVGRPGNRLFIKNNVVENVNDNAITVVDGYRLVDATPSSDIHIEDNVIREPLGTGIFFGVDGETWTDRLWTTRNIHIARNFITGNWRDACITGMLPTNTEKIHIVNNICTKTGVRGAFPAGIRLARVREVQKPAQDILVGFNTITAHPRGSLDHGGIFIAGPHHRLRIVGNEVRNVGPRAMYFLYGDIRDAVVSNNIVAGGAMVIEGNFAGLVHDNLLVASLDLGLRFIANPGETITASLRDNVIKNPTAECMQWWGPGTYQIDLVGNTFANCGGAASIVFLNGAAPAAGSIRLHNHGDHQPHAAPTHHLQAIMLWDPPPLPDGASAGVKVPISGASPGDVTSAGFESLTTGDWHISAYVQSSDHVRVVITNHTGSALDLPHGTLRVSVWKFE